jgi:hypothetical protein
MRCQLCKKAEEQKECYKCKKKVCNKCLITRMCIECFSQYYYVDKEGYYEKI